MKAREVAVLAYLREHADADGCCPATRSQIGAALGVASSTVQLAVTGLEGAGLIHVDGRRPGVSNAYCLNPSAMTDPPLTSTETSTDRSTETLTESVDPLASARSLPPPTPSHGVSGSPIPEGSDRPNDRTTERPTSVDVVSLGQAAARAVVEGARSAGRAVVADLGRVGKAAKDLEAEGVEVAAILTAATRVGVAGTEDIRTAVEAVKERRALPVGRGTPPAEGARTASCIRLLLGTWPRAQIDAALWEEELGKIQERFLLMAVRAIARQGAEFAPTWGQVWKAAHEIGQPIIGAERSERARQAELARDAARQAAS